MSHKRTDANSNLHSNQSTKNASTVDKASSDKVSSDKASNPNSTNEKHIADNASKWNARHAYEKGTKQSVEADTQSASSTGANAMSQIDTFEAMLAKGQDSDMLRFTLGNAYYKEKRLDEAAAHLREAVKLNPEYSVAWKVLGRVLSDNEQYEEALVAFDAGLEVALKNGDKQVEKEMTVFKRRAEKKRSSP